MCIERTGLIVIGRARKPMAFHPRWVRGFSLIELIVFMVIVSVALAGVLSVLNFTTRNSAEPLIRKQMLTIAEALLEEVQMKPFTFCDPIDATAATATAAVLGAGGCTTLVQAFGHTGGATRSTYNNVGNYCAEVGTDSLACTPVTLGTAGSATSRIEDITGVSGNSPPGYWATITLTPQALGPGGANIASAAGSAAALNVILITVTVSYVNSSETVTVQGYRTRWAPNI